MYRTLAKKILLNIEKRLNIRVIVSPYKNRPTATKSNLGFWYAGDVLNESDIAYGIMRNGIVEKEDITLVKNILSQLPKDDFVFFDIGANSGLYGIATAHLFPKSRVFSFEPLTEYIKIIKENAFLNRLEDRYQYFETALGETETTGNIELAGSGSSLTPGFLGKNSNNETREIKISSLDKLQQKENIPLPDFIKIDVEGFELSVLKGSSETLKQSKPLLFIEIANTLRRGHDTYVNKEAKQVFDLLLSLGYNGYVVKDGVKPTSEALSEEGVFMYLFTNTKNETHKKLKF